MVEQRMVDGPFEREIVQRLGLMPNLFMSAPSAPEMTRQLWQFAKCAYLDAPLPALFKERLAVHLSRFGRSPYCLTRHFGFLVGLGNPAGDPACRPETIAQARQLLSRPLADPARITAALDRLEAVEPPVDIPEPGSDCEADLFDAASALFTQSAASDRSHGAIRHAFGEIRFELLAAFLAYLRMAHFWADAHPELTIDPDVLALARSDPELAAGLNCRPFCRDDLPPAAGLKPAMNIDDHMRTEVALRDSDTRFREFAEAASDVVWIRNAETLKWEYLSPAFETIYGVSRAAVLRGDNLASWTELMFAEDRPRVIEALERARNGERNSVDFRIIRQTDGATRWLRIRTFPIVDDSGRLPRIGGMTQDITAQVSAAEHQKLLLAELQHRVRNMLAVIRSIIRRTGDSSDSVEDFASHLEGRITALARIHAVVTRDPLAGFDLAELIADELRASAAREGKQFSLSGPSVRIKPKAAESIGLTMHELATNALKYGALTVPRGFIRIEWRLDEGDTNGWLVIEWIETGMSGRQLGAHRQGFGTTLLEQLLPYDVGARVDWRFDPSGLRCEIRLPADHILKR